MLKSLTSQALLRNVGALSADDQDVGLGQQRIERFFLDCILKVNAHAALVGIQVKEHPAPVRVGMAVREGTVPPVTVTAGRFHLHHVGSGVSEQPGTE